MDAGPVAPAKRVQVKHAGSEQSTGYRASAGKVNEEDKAQENQEKKEKAVSEKTTIAEQMQDMTQDEIISFLIGVLDGHQYLIEKQQGEIDVLKSVVDYLGREQKISRAAMPFGGV